MKITVYSTSWCPYCHALMSWLDDLGVKYTEKDAEKLLDAPNSPIQSVPATDVDGELIYGFNRPAILKLIKQPEKGSK